MIDVATLSVIRRWALREQLSIREIARRTGLSRNTIRKYLRAGEAEPHYPKWVQARSFRIEALGLAQDGSWSIPQVEACRLADVRRTAGPGLYQLLQPGCRPCPAVAPGWSALTV